MDKYNTIYCNRLVMHSVTPE